MKHVFRFVASEREDGVWVLASDEAHHALKVLRLASGDTCEVTDGHGRWARGEFARLTDKTGEVRVGDVSEEPEVRHRLTVALGTLKPATFDDLLPSLIELGADAVQVIAQEQAAKGQLKDSVRARWQRILQGACKQSKRARFPVLQVFASWDAWFAAVTPGEVVVLDPAAADTCLGHEWTGGSRVLLCGGEKGFTREEDKVLADRGLARVRLGGAIMRAETAALAAAAIFNARRDRL